MEPTAARAAAVEPEVEISTNQPTTTQPAQVLDQALTSLGEMGIAPPLHLTLRRYLRLLVELGATSQAQADRFASLHEAASFGGAECPDTEAAEAATGLVADITAWVGNGSEIDRLRDLLSPAQMPPTEVRPPETAIAMQPEDDLSEVDPQWLPDPEPEPADTIALHQRWRHFGWRGIGASIVLLLLWSGSMVAIGIWQTDNIAWLTAEIDYLFLGGVRGSAAHDQVTLLRLQATRHPDSAGIWQSYADAARRANHWEETTAALRHLLVRNPDNAELLNDLAWLLCTTPAEHLRDPVEALALAERAFELNSAPHITDTLAEAAFQTGNVQRAVALERDALSRIPGNAEFYRQQLAKFEAALPP